MDILSALLHDFVAYQDVMQNSDMSAIGTWPVRLSKMMRTMQMQSLERRQTS